MTFWEMLRGSEDETISEDELIMQMEGESRIGHGKRKSSQLYCQIFGLKNFSRQL